jgi:hypothetical protein
MGTIPPGLASLAEGLLEPVAPLGVGIFARGPFRLPSWV